MDCIITFQKKAERYRFVCMKYIVQREMKIRPDRTPYDSLYQKNSNIFLDEQSSSYRW